MLIVNLQYRSCVQFTISQNSLYQGSLYQGLRQYINAFAKSNKRYVLNVINVPFILLSIGVGSMASGVGHQQPDLHGIYDHNGGGICSLDHNEALTASYLYPELYNVTSSRPRRHQRPTSSVSSTLSSSTITASSQTTAVVN